MEFKKNTTMGDLANFMSETCGDMIYPHDKIGNDTVKNVRISTVSRDIAGFLYETALLHEDECYPCERYKNEADAKEGHDRWVKKIEGAEKELKFIYLGDGYLFEDEEQIIQIK